MQFQRPYSGYPPSGATNKPPRCLPLPEFATNKRVSVCIFGWGQRNPRCWHGMYFDLHAGLGRAGAGPESVRCPSRSVQVWRQIGKKSAMIKDFAMDFAVDFAVDFA